jgi:hypothetical protein
VGRFGQMVGRSRMSPFRIAPAGASFKVVENLPDGRHASVGGFLTMIDAQEWLIAFSGCSLVGCRRRERPHDC